MIGRARSGLLRRVAGRRRPAGLILCYHHVGGVEVDPWLLCVSPEKFADRPLVALTFDDGYADNLRQAKPLLEAADVAATVFVVSGAVGRGREFWWDELERGLLTPEATASKLELRTKGRTTTWRLADSPYGASEHERHRSWNAIEADDPLARHGLFRSAYAALRAASEDERAAGLATLLDGRDARARETHRPLSEEELLLLAEGGLVEIGAHTVTHPVLSDLSEADQRREVRQSRAELEALLGRPVRLFAYPFGQRDHYTAETVKAVREAGYALACSTLPGCVHRRTSRFELPRFTVLDWDGDEFAKALAGWAGG